MIIRILVIFLITFTPIKCIPCIENPNCDCSSIYPLETNIVCDVNNSTRFNITIKSRNEVKIICKDWSGWENFNFKSKRTDLILEYLLFEKCEFSNNIGLKDVVKQLGAKGTKILIFQSFKSLYRTLKKEHLQGFESLKKLILSHNGLTNIPSDLFFDIPQLEYIDLSINNIDLPVDIFSRNSNLKRINLTSSGIYNIPVGTFNNLTNLEYLNIISNLLHEIKAGTFDQLVSLKYLDLSRNYLVDLPLPLFHDLKNLEKLDISRNHISSIPPTLFEKNVKLKELYLNNNEMSSLSENLLSYLKELQHVYLNNNKFTSLPEKLFWKLNSLQRIYLNDNSLITLSVKIFRGLKNVTFLSLKNNKRIILPDNIFKDMENLKVLDLSNNAIDHISNDLFNGLVSLKELNIERNQINYISREVFLSLKNLNIARLSHNPIKFNHTNHQLPIFDSNQHLKELYLSNCSIKQFFDDWSTGNNELRILDLRHNMISNVSTTLFTLPSLEIVVDLSYNKITNLNLDRIEEIASKSKEDRNTVIFMKHNPFLCDCSFYNILRYDGKNMSRDVYDKYSIKFDNLTCLSIDGVIAKEMSNLHFENYTCSEDEYFNTTKQCQYHCQCNIRLSDHTRILNCSYDNKIEFVIDKSKFNYQKDYPLIIDLTGNYLTEIPSTESLYPINVTSLLLSNNNISNVTLDKLPTSLQVLELHNNNLSIINSTVVDYLKSIAWKKFTLSGNPILCTCDNQDLINFVISNNFNHEDLKNLKCAHTDIAVHGLIIDDFCNPALYLMPTVIIILVIVLIVCLVSGYYYLLPRLQRRIFRKRDYPIFKYCFDTRRKSI